MKINKRKWQDWFLYNLVYCGDTHSFVHRLMDKLKDCKDDYHIAQYRAQKIIEDMWNEYQEVKK